MRNFRILFIIITFLLVSKITHAHPHVFMDVSINPVFDSFGLKAVKQKWTFDELFSNTIVSEYDIDKNGKLDIIEARMVKKGAFDNLAEFNYYTYLYLNGKQLEISEIDGFEAGVENGRMFYSFIIPLEKRYDSGVDELVAYVYDEQFYADIKILDKSFAEINTGNAPAYSHKVAIDKGRTYYFGLVTPQRMTMRFAKSESSEDNRNLFVSGSNTDDQSVLQSNLDAGVEEENKAGVLRKYIFVYQQKLNTTISSKLKEYQKNKSGSFLLSLLFMSFIYGLVHAAGPGHGKSVSASYFMSRGGTFSEPFIFGFTNSFIHAYSSVLIVMVFKLFLDSFKYSAFGYISNTIQIVSYGLICLVGLVLLFNALRETRKLNKNYFDVYGEGFGVDKKVKPKRKGMYALIISSGIIPCPGALVIMIFCYSMNATFLGFLLTTAMAFGMATTVTVSGLIALGGRTGVFKAASVKNEKSPLMHFFSIAGALCVLLAGGLMLASKLAFI